MHQTSWRCKHHGPHLLSVNRTIAGDVKSKVSSNRADDSVENVDSSARSEAYEPELGVMILL